MVGRCSRVPTSESRNCCLSCEGHPPPTHLSLRPEPHPTGTCLHTPLRRACVLKTRQGQPFSNLWDPSKQMLMGFPWVLIQVDSPSLHGGHITSLA